MAAIAENVGPPATNRCHGRWQSVAVWQGDAGEFAQLALPRYPLRAARISDYAALISAATPGRVLPSIHSRKAPPAAET